VYKRVDFVKPDRAYSWVNVTDINVTTEWPEWFGLHSRWDSGFYIWIAQYGYHHDNAAFLPLYPLSIRIATMGWSILTGAAPTLDAFTGVGVIISNISALGTALGLYALARLDLSESDAEHALFYFLIFPTAFFLTVVYAESLFMFWVVTSVYFARRHRWLFASALGACAVLTRVTGLWLFPTLLVEWWGIHREQKWQGVALLLMPMAFLAYEIYLRTQGMSFFVSQQEVFGRWPLDPTALLKNIDFEYLWLHAAAQAHHIIEIAIAIGVMLLSLYAGKQLRPSYGVFGLLCVLGPLLTGTIVSLERYSLAAFPIFLVLGRNRHLEWLESGYTLSAILLLGLYTLFFVGGYWAG
jgi:hypothetical protein